VNEERSFIKSDKKEIVEKSFSSRSVEKSKAKKVKKY
jgi:hypothetical protein